MGEPLRLADVEPVRSLAKAGRRALPLLTTSAERAYRSCPRLYFWRYEELLRPTYEDPNLSFGKLGHRGLEAWWLAAQHDPADLPARLKAAIDAVANETDPFDRAKATAVMCGYHARWCGVEMEVLAVEAEFQAPLINPVTNAASRTWRKGGKLDAVARILGRTYVVEHKTSGEDIGEGSAYWRRLTMDPQVSNYHVGARVLGFDVDGCLYDVIRKPKQRPLQVNKKNKSDETPDEYFTRIVSVLAEMPEGYFRRGEIVRLADEERDAARNSWLTGAQIHESRRLAAWPMNADACHKYGRDCDYRPLCERTSTPADGTKFRRAERAHEELEGESA